MSYFEDMEDRQDRELLEVPSCPVCGATTHTSLAHSLDTCNHCEEDLQGLLQSCAKCGELTCISCSLRRPNDYVCRHCTIVLRLRS